MNAIMIRYGIIAIIKDGIINKINGIIIAIIAQTIKPN